MSEEDIYIGGTSIQIGQHGFINQPKEIIEYIKYLQTKLQENEYSKLSNPEMNLEHWRVVGENKRKIDNLRKHNKQLKSQLQQKENIIKEVREKLNTQLAFTSSYQLNYQSAISIIEEAKQILDKEDI